MLKAKIEENRGSSGEETCSEILGHINVTALPCGYLGKCALHYGFPSGQLLSIPQVTERFSEESL